MTAFKKIYITDEVDGHTANVNSSGEISVSTDTLNTLNQTLLELVSRLDVLAGMANSGAPALRTIPIASVATSVSGTVAVSSLTNFGTGIPASESANAENRAMVALSNINNVSITN